MREKRDIVLVMSDQHCDVQEVFGGLMKPSDTPAMEKLAREGVRYDHCYASAPLCVPSRMSFLTGKMPSELNIFNNDCALPSDVPTLAHELGILGYHTVLCGRMHWKGEDQHHGFDERLCGDITSQYWGTGGKKRTDFGVYAGTTNRLHCLEAVGAGVSPVQVYDKMVCQEALDFLDKLERLGDDRPPVFLVVGFYGPHFPYVCEETLFFKYQQRISLEECEKDRKREAFPLYEGLKQECDAELIRDCRAAYCGMVETLDGYIGKVYNRFCSLEYQSDRPSLFCYTSDHGEQLGRRKIFGKQTLYEEALRVPLFWAGSGIPKGIVKKQAVSLLDVSRTILEMADDEKREYCRHHGHPLRLMEEAEDQEKKYAWVRAQQMICRDGRWSVAELAVNERYQIWCVDGDYAVYDLQNRMEKKETADQIVSDAESAGCFLEEEERKRLIRMEELQTEEHKRLTLWGLAKAPKEPASVQIPEGCLKGPWRDKGEGEGKNRG